MFAYLLLSLFRNAFSIHTQAGDLAGVDGLLVGSYILKYRRAYVDLSSACKCLPFVDSHRISLDIYSPCNQDLASQLTGKMVRFVIAYLWTFALAKVSLHQPTWKR